MLKYRGQYRISCEFDMRDLQPIKTETFLVCLNGGKIYRINDKELCYYNPIRKPSVIAKTIESGIWYDSWVESETAIEFLEKDLEIMAKIVGVPKSGTDVPPTSKRNLRFMYWYKK